MELGTTLKAIDNKNRDFYNQASEESQKKFSPFVMMRYISNCEGDRDTQEWFLLMTHESVNLNHWSLSKDHRDLLWKCCTVVGAGFPVRHNYLPAPSRKKSSDKFFQILEELYPALKISDIEVINSSLTIDDKKAILEGHGIEPKEFKNYLK